MIKTSAWADLISHMVDHSVLIALSMRFFKFTFVRVRYVEYRITSSKNSNSAYSRVTSEIFPHRHPNKLHFFVPWGLIKPISYRWGTSAHHNHQESDSVSRFQICQIVDRASQVTSLRHPQIAVFGTERKQQLGIGKMAHRTSGKYLPVPL